MLLFLGIVNGYRFCISISVNPAKNNNIINKQTIYEHIIGKYKQFEYEYLMNPYL